VQTARIISIVDDDEAVCVATSSLLRSLGWQTYTFASAEALLQSAHLSATSCIVTDVRMPGMSGIDLYLHLLSLGFVIPTIFVTAFPTAALRARVTASGGRALLAKPIDPDAITQCLDQIFGTP
jgi:FixJ family two-component response regulator